MKTTAGGPFHRHSHATRREPTFPRVSSEAHLLLLFMTQGSQMAIVIRRSAARSGISAILLVGAAIGLLGPARAEDQNDARSGEQLAQKLCSSCHLVERLPGPSFMDIARGDHASPDALRNFLRSTHSDVSHPGAMPNPGLSDEQIRAIAAYLSTLRGPKWRNLLFPLFRWFDVRRLRSQRVTSAAPCPITWLMR
jgi:mono/diheme cytochrome c family protein